MTKRQLLNRFLQLLLLAAIFYFFAPSFVESFRKFNPAAWRINYPLLIGSLLLMQIVLYGQSAIWATIITFFDKRVTYNKAFKIAYLSQLGRYLPGRIWQLFGMIYLAAKEGITKEEATVSFVLSQIFTTPPGLLVVVVYLFLMPETASKYHPYSGFAWVGGAICIVFLAIYFLPGLFKKMINLATRMLRQPEVEFQMKKKVGMQVLGFYFVTWNLYGISFYLFLKSILPEADFGLVEIIGAWTLAYLVGYWAIILPAGIGAREAALMVLLTPIVGADRAGIAVIGSRVWSMIGELICTLLAWRVK
jgi:glycosyltransferase 2 family protein